VYLCMERSTLKMGEQMGPWKSFLLEWREGTWIYMKSQRAWKDGKGARKCFCLSREREPGYMKPGNYQVFGEGTRKLFLSERREGTRMYEWPRNQETTWYLEREPGNCFCLSGERVPGCMNGQGTRKLPGIWRGRGNQEIVFV
jgi:hypothetical protein